jgi:hypothetical protein
MNEKIIIQSLTLKPTIIDVAWQDIKVVEIANHNIENNNIKKNSPGILQGKSLVCKISILDPGVVGGYQDFPDEKPYNIILLKEDVVQNMVQCWEGVNVCWGHDGKEAVGCIVNPQFNHEKNTIEAQVAIFCKNEKEYETLKNRIKNCSGTSCAYKVIREEAVTVAETNGVDCQSKVTLMQPLHVAFLENEPPRYSRSRNVVILNSLTPKPKLTNLTKEGMFNKKQKNNAETAEVKENAASVKQNMCWDSKDYSNMVASVQGYKIPMNKIMEAYNRVQSQPKVMNETDMITIGQAEDGGIKEISVAELVEIAMQDPELYADVAEIIDDVQEEESTEMQPEEEDKMENASDEGMMTDEKELEKSRSDAIANSVSNVAKIIQSIQSKFNSQKPQKEAPKKLFNGLNGRIQEAKEATRAEDQVKVEEKEGHPVFPATI